MLFNLWAKLTYFFSDFWPYLLVNLVALILFVYLLIKVIRSNYSEVKKKVFFASLTSFICFISLFSFFELYFRYIYDQSDGLGFLKVNSRWHQRHVVHNSYFFRDRDFDPHKKEHVVRIGALGDSITFGGGIENYQDRFSNILEKKLNDAGYSVEVYNLGKPGFDTEAEIKQYQDVKNLNFDIIIWQYFLNDIQPTEKSTGTSIISRNSTQQKFTKFLSDKSYFFDFLYWRLSSRYSKTFEELKTADIAQYHNDQLLNNHQAQIRDFVENLKKENKKVVVILFPLINALGPNYPATDVHNLMTEYFKEIQVETIDLLEDLKEKEPKNLIASHFDPHPNESVHKLAAEKLFEVIAPLLK